MRMRVARAAGIKDGASVAPMQGFKQEVEAELGPAAAAGADPAAGTLDLMRRKENWEGAAARAERDTAVSMRTNRVDGGGFSLHKLIVPYVLKGGLFSPTPLDAQIV